MVATPLITRRLSPLVTFLLEIIDRRTPKVLMLSESGTPVWESVLSRLLANARKFAFAKLFLNPARASVEGRYKARRSIATKSLIKRTEYALIGA
jgi:hypothetical protein